MLTRKEVQVLELRSKGLKQIEVSKKLGISQAAVSKFENNAKEKIRKAYRIIEIAKKLKVEVQEDEI